MSGIEKILEHTAQGIVYCNCATEGPALKRCEHVSLYEALRERLLPLLEAGEAMKEAGGDLAFSEYGVPATKYPAGHIARSWADSEEAWDAAKKKAME